MWLEGLDVVDDAQKILHKLGSLKEQDCVKGGAMAKVFAKTLGNLVPILADFEFGEWLDDVDCHAADKAEAKLAELSQQEVSKSAAVKEAYMAWLGKVVEEAEKEQKEAGVPPADARSDT